MSAIVPNCVPALVAIGIATLATAQGGGLCPTGATGPCTSPHATPGCEDTACCELVCGYDPFCCSAYWDAYCAYVIQPALCTGPPPVPCGSPTAGPCDQPHSTPSCSDASCCELVCAVLPTCCTVSWDGTCATLASTNCSTQCDPPCPSGGIAESESCGIQSNSACMSGTANPTLQAFANGTTICGKIQQINDLSPDTDAYRVVVTDPDGNGLARLTMEFDAKGPAFAALLPDPCSALDMAVIHLQVASCDAQFAAECIPPGTWYVVVARGTYPTPTPFEDGCGLGQKYTLRISWNDQCINPCGTGGGCYDIHTTPGCEESACCASVCQLDPVCCEKSWDQICVDEALALCNPPPPLNDLCSNARPITPAGAAFTLVGATSDPAPVPAGCLTLGGTTLGADVWYSIEDVEGSVTISSCTAGTLDTALLVYDSSCTSEPIACDDDNATCSGNPLSSSVSFMAQCHHRYLIRVGAIGQQFGTGSLTVSLAQPQCPGCPADITDDLLVDGLDLTALLSGWGEPGPADVDDSGVVDGLDLTAVLSAWGTCP